VAGPKAEGQEDQPEEVLEEIQTEDPRGEEEPLEEVQKKKVEEGEPVQKKE
jgi:hypothetical protein